jgi:photosystem II stability/assembly factor-like uncharacterized protein
LSPWRASRHWLGLTLALPLALWCPPTARAADDLASLSTPAIQVRAPDKVVLIAATRAGSRLFAAGEHGVIIYSDDDGKHWMQASVPVDVTLTAIAFVSPQSGWAAGHYGAILHTSDGGVTWQLQLNGTQANNLTLAAAQAAQADHDASPGTPLALLRASHFLATGADKPFLSILPFSPTSVTVFGAYRLVMHSDDAGRHWEDWSLHIGDRLSQHLYAAALVGREICVAGEAGQVFCSNDSGATFPPVTSPGPATLLGLLATPHGAMLGFGVAGLAYRSADLGTSWSAISLGAQSNLTAGLVLRSGAILIGCEDGSLYLSTDDGASFRMLQQTEPMALYDMTQAANGNVILVGSGGVITLPANFAKLD